jgi:hypothetical protein
MMAGDDLKRVLIRVGERPSDFMLTVDGVKIENVTRVAFDLSANKFTVLTIEMYVGELLVDGILQTESAIFNKAPSER